MRTQLTFCLFLLACATPVYAEVSQFVFTTEARTVGVSTISDPLTIQSQNSTNTQESVAETMDVSFKSSSVTGEFLNSSGNPVSTTMSKNTANRTFYYRDATSGTHTLTVTFTGRDTQKVYIASQQIVVGSVQATTTPPASTTTDTQKETTQSQVTTTLSAHSDPVPLSDIYATLPFEVTSGRDRLATVGSELTFKGEVNKKSGISEQYLEYTWNFGDGTTAQGQVVTHRYKFSGDYIVLLTARFSDKVAVSKTNVSVVETHVSALRVLGGIQITNNSLGEINIGEWRIVTASSVFTIPKDTLIGKRNTITLPLSFVLTDDMSIQNPLGVEMIKLPKEVSVGATTSPQIQATTSLAVTIPVTKPVYRVSQIQKKTPQLPATSTQVATIYVATPKHSQVQALFSWPDRTFLWMKSLFK